MPPLHSWVIPPSDVPITRCAGSPVQRELTVYLTHLYLVPRVIALPGQHFSHFSSKSGMTNQCVIHVFPPFQIRCSINTNSQWLQQRPVLFLWARALPAWRHHGGPTTLNGHIESDITPMRYTWKHSSSLKGRPRKDRVEKSTLSQTIFPPGLSPALRNISQQSGNKLTFFKVDSIIEY